MSEMNLWPLGWPPESWLNPPLSFPLGLSVLVGDRGWSSARHRFASSSDSLPFDEALSCLQMHPEERAHIARLWGTVPHKEVQTYAVYPVSAPGFVEAQRTLGFLHTASVHVGVTWIVHRQFTYPADPVEFLQKHFARELHATLQYVGTVYGEGVILVSDHEDSLRRPPLDRPYYTAPARSEHLVATYRKYVARRKAISRVYWAPPDRVDRPVLRITREWFPVTGLEEMLAVLEPETMVWAR